MDSTGGTLGLPAGLPSDNIFGTARQYEVGEPGSTGRDSVVVASYEPYVRWVNREITVAEPHVMAQREAMTESWKFNDGHQLSDEDLRMLRNQRRPDTAINELQKFIRFATGIERRTRQALLFAARTAEDQQAQLKSEFVTKGYEWFCETGLADYERSRAFESMVVAGLGISEPGLSNKRDPNGRPRYSFCDAGQFLFPECSKENFGLDTDSPIKWMGRETWMLVEEAIDKWPDAAIYLRAAGGGQVSTAQEDQLPYFGRGPGKPVNYVVPYIMTEPLNKSGGSDESRPGQVKILEMQHHADEPGYYFYDPLQRDAAWLNESDFRKLRNRYMQLFKQPITDYAKQTHRVYRRGYLLQRRILLEEPKPLTGITGDVGFTWNVMTGLWDRTDKVWRGRTQIFIAPQRYANAMFRQVLEILGSSHKNGAFVETMAMSPAQRRDYEERGAAPGAINVVQPGAISQNRILLKNIPQLPQGSMEVLSFCVDMMEKVSGLSMSLLGADQSNTPGVSLRRRLTSGMVLLAAEFDALSRFRKREGYLVYQYLKLIADDRWIRVGGAANGQALQLAKAPFALDYDVTLDEYDQDPNMRQYYQDQIMALAPILIRTGNFIPELLDYVNLPYSFRQSLKQGIQQGEQQKMQMAMQGISVGGRGKPRGLEEIKADTQLKQARATEHMAKAQAIQQGVGRDDLKAIMDTLLQHRKQEQDHNRGNLQEVIKAFQALSQHQKQENNATA